MAMYLEHFGLLRAPFAMHPDPDFLYLSDQHSSAKAFLESSAFVNDSFFVITGSIGAGKTTLVEGFLSELPSGRTVIARINQTQLSPTGFLRLLLDELGLEAFKAKKPQLLARLRKYLAKCTRENLKVVVVVDEAQNLENEVLEEIRMLTGNQEASCLSIVLVGQPEFLDTLESPQMRQLAQRCRLRSTLKPLEEAETVEYVRHRLAVAGVEDEDLFDDLALLQVHELTGGVPRLINSLCDTALICAFADGLEVVDTEVLEAAAEELNWDASAVARNSHASGSASADQTENLKSARDKARQRRALSQRDRKITELEQALSESEAALAELQTEADALKATSSSADSNDAGLKPALDRLGTEFAARLQKIEELQQSLDASVNDPGEEADEDLQAETELLQEQQEALEDRLQQSETLLESLAGAGTVKNSAAAEELGALQETLVQKDDELKQLRKQVESLEVQSAELAKSENELDEKEQALQELRGTVNTLEQRIDSDDTLQAELEEKQRELQALENTVADLEHSVSENERREEELTALQKELDDVRGELAQAQDQQQIANDDHQAASKECDSLRDTLAERDQQLAELKEAHNELSERDNKIAEIEDQLQARAGEVEDLHRRLEDESNARQGAQREADSTGGELAELQAAQQAALLRVSELEATLRETEDQLQAAGRRAGDLTQEVAELVPLREELNARDARIESLDARIGELESELATTQEARNRATEELEAATASLEKAAGERLELERKISGRDNSIVTLEAEVRRKNRLIDELHDKLGPLPALEDQVAVLGNENTELCDEVESRNERIFELQEALSLSRQRLDEARHEIDSSHNQHVGLHREVSELQAEISRLHEGTNQRDDLVTSLQAECQNRKQDLRKLRRQLDESMDQSRELRDTVELGEDRVRQLESELAAAMETISEMSEAGSAANSSAREIEAELDEKAGEVATLQQALVENQEKLTAMEAVLKEKTETIKVLELDAETAEAQADDGEDSAVAAPDQLVLQLRGEIEARDQRIIELESSVHNLSESLAAATEQLSMQSDHLRELEQQLESSRAAAAELREELGETDREFDRTAVLGDDDADLADTDARPVSIDAGLLVSTNGRPTRKIPLRSDRLIIGRTRDSDIKIDNEYASRHHAQIVYEQGNFVLEDLNSTNGIYVNAKRVKRRMLRDRDVISIGPDKLIFVREQHTSH